MDNPDLYTRKAYVQRHKNRLQHQKEKQQETTKVWVLSLPKNQLDLRCHSDHSVRVDEFFHSSLYFQWCIRRFRKRLASSFPSDGDVATLIYEYMMAVSERSPFDTYNLTDQQILLDARGVFSVIEDGLSFPSMNSNGMLQYGTVTHKPDEAGSSSGMNCWAHRISRDHDTILETCQNEGLQFRTLPSGERKTAQPFEEQVPTGTASEQSPTQTSNSTTSDLPTASIEGYPDPPSEESPSILQQIGTIIERSASEHDPPPSYESLHGASVSATRPTPTDKTTGKDSDEGKVPPRDPSGSDMGYRDACREISDAISEGAPAYNEGDHNGCYNIYKQTAEEILDRCSIKGVQKELRSALDSALKQPSFTERAWILRHAFDAIRSGNIDGANLDEDDREELLATLDGDEMSLSDAVREITAAIERGAPTYNVGDHKGCYTIYRQSAETILEHCNVPLVQEELRSALELSLTQSSFTTRAWTLRGAFDIIRRGERVGGNNPHESDEEDDEEEEEASPSGGQNSGGDLSYKDVCREISVAISKGAPTYNDGNHRGCFEIYKQTAVEIVDKCSIGAVRRELQTALDTVNKQASFTTRAWTMRHAFDAILRGQINNTTESAGGDGSEREDPLLASLRLLLGRRGTL